MDILRGDFNLEPFTLPCDPLDQIVSTFAVDPEPVRVQLATPWEDGDRWVSSRVRAGADTLEEIRSIAEEILPAATITPGVVDPFSELYAPRELHYLNTYCDENTQFAAVGWRFLFGPPEGRRWRDSEPTGEGARRLQGEDIVFDRVVWFSQDVTGPPAALDSIELGWR